MLYNITVRQQSLLVESPARGILRVCLGAEGPCRASPIGILPPSSPYPAVAEESPGEYRFDAGSLKLRVDKATGSLSWETGGGGLLVSQPFPELTAKTVYRYHSEGGPVHTVKTVDGERNFSGPLVPREDRGAWRAKVFFNFAEDEGIHGLGQAEEGIYDYRGRTQYLYQHNMRIPVPFFMSTRGYGVLFDCGCLLTFNGDMEHPYLFFDTLDALDFYVIRGDSPDGIIAGMRTLTGKAPLLPKWAFGYIQSKEAYHTQNELVETAREYRRRHVPLDCVVQDWNTWEPGKWGDKRLDKSRYPDIAGANRELHSMNVHSMVSVWPNARAGGDHDEFEAAGFLLEDQAAYNAFDREARKLYWEQANRELFSGGFDSWWCDSTEPFSGPDWSGPTLREPWERFLLVGEEHKKYLDPALANCYALEHAWGIYENQRAETEEKRVLNLTRSGWAGSQRYGAVLWSGDTSARWDVLKKQIREGLNFCMSGLPWWTMDIGGFFTVREKRQNRGCGMDKNPEPFWFWQGDFEDGVQDPGYRELYLRWLQLGCFLPVFRSHGTDTPREIWNFGEPGDIFYDAIESFIRLRYRLMPYIYSLAAMVSLDDYTMLRSLLFDFWDDQKARTVEEEFMFGPAFLVCPVTEPFRFGPGGIPLNKKEEWPCCLPEGVQWHDFWTGEFHTGGREITVPAPPERLPLFVRAGSIVPVETAPLEYAGQVSGEPLEIRVYPGADGSFSLYEDSGDGYDYEKGNRNRITLEWNDRDRILTMGPGEYRFPQSILNRPCLIRAGKTLREIRYTGKPLQVMLGD
jgi:alpha-D-xyloside xylohydrolase